MLLRSISKHVKDQNWFAVGLDFSIVVVGVFVGLQVNNWNTNRQDHVDEKRFIQQLHADLLLAEKMSGRLLKRRLSSAVEMSSALDVLFGRTAERDLSQAECTAIFVSSRYSISIAELGSVNELVASGRVGIIRDPTLRTEMLSLQQRAKTARNNINIYMQVGNALETQFPTLVEMDSYFNVEDNEIRAKIRCNLAAMRENRGFLNAVSHNVDVYDAFIRDDLAPWKEQTASVHAKVDAALKLSHKDEKK